jgi:glucose/arabinose dehydrogenase
VALARGVLAALLACGVAVPAGAVPALAADPAAVPKVESVPGAPVALDLYPVGQGFTEPLLLVEPPDGSGRLLVVEQGGRVRLLTPGALTHPVYLDMRPLVTSGGERGLLGLAFHPKFKDNGFLFVDYTDRRGDITVARLKADPAHPERVDPGTLKVILSIPNPAPNHNGGMLAFGPDGYLYIATGDGGGAGDPFQNGQNTFSYLGKILRIDVDAPPEARSNGHPYGIPADNPFLRLSAYRPEIWALGLRNPWRFAFDPKTGDLFIADVGQDAWEEVDYHAAAAPGGDNYGWSQMEGRHCYPPKNKSCDFGTPPVAEYSHESGCSITGGFVYRGPTIPKLDGVYLFSDYCSGGLWGLLPDKARPGTFHMRRYLEAKLAVSSFGQDRAGEVYLLDHKRGGVWRVVPAGWKPPAKAPGKADPKPTPRPRPAPPDGGD